MRAFRGTPLSGRRSGQGLVEFAMVLPLLLLLLLGLVEFARAWNLHQVLTDAGREAARTAVVDNGAVGADSVEAVVEAAIARARFDPSAAVITTDGLASGRGNAFTISIAYPHRLRLIQGFMRWTSSDATFTLRTSTTMRNE